MLSSTRVGFVGAGQMARAIGFPLIRNKLLEPSQIIASSPDDSFLVPWKQLGCRTSKENGEVVSNSDAVIWAVKPQIFPAAVEATKESRTEPPHPEASPPVKFGDKFHISIMAGLPLETFHDTLAKHFERKQVRTARVMPNIASTVNMGCSVFTMGSHTHANYRTLLTEIFSSSGLCYEVPESQINAYCGLFSSGVGFMFVILEAMSDAAVQNGIPRDLSLQIAGQTMRGASELLLSNSSIHPGTWKDSVCSPGGTTIAGIAEMERCGVRGGIIRAIAAATTRGEQLGKIK